MGAYEALEERGFIEQVTDEGGLRKLLERERITCYIGFDPTARSFHVGSLVPIMALVHMQREGHRPIALVGGGTGLIGDPSGKKEMRKIMTREEVEANAEALKAQLAHFLDFEGERALLLNNADWLTKLNYIEFLRDIGRHFSVNRMLAAETYRMRLSTGLNFVEFNYMLLQAYDFLYLYQNYGCVLQMGGRDQWGNICAGIDLIRRVEGGDAYGLVFPLITTASGGKMGKTEKGTVWLDPELTSPYEYYQYWINTDDRDVERFLALFTLLPMEEVRRYGKLKGEELREAKEVLAYEVTRLTHGEEAARKAQEASRAIFRGEGGDLEAMPTSYLERSRLEEGILAYELFVLSGLASSRSEARRLISQGGGYLNGRRVESFEQRVTVDDLQGGSIILRAGKKRYHRLVVK
ncbi:MAG: tyrosine--tRNA ligase [Deltaproteobacteria bacterium]|nr:MAG: tyrosine--tRNA ligase [Deltaproteobacteria bacterium]RLA96430.1 MAG: tyrosine--tRNA ligase [Deltaproteobacteria bacterium]